MPAIRRLARAGLALALFAGAASAAGACGGSDVDARTWAKSVCGALAPWRSQISGLTAQAQQQIGSATTAADTKTRILALLGGAEAASEKARKGVVDAGVPHVTDGAEIAKRFAASLTAARDAYGHAKNAVAGLPTDRPTTFYANVKTTFDTLGAEYAKSAVDTDHVGSKDLQQAFDEVPECG